MARRAIAMMKAMDIMVKAQVAMVAADH